MIAAAADDRETGLCLTLRDVHGSYARLARTPDRVVARYPGTPEPGAGHHALAGVAGRNAQTTRPAALNLAESA